MLFPIYVVAMGSATRYEESKSCNHTQVDFTILLTSERSLALYQKAIYLMLDHQTHTKFTYIEPIMSLRLKERVYASSRLYIKSIVRPRLTAFSKSSMDCF